MNIDIRNIFEPPIRQFIFWLATVLLVTFGGKQPGVVCITPMAWLLALRVGNICSTRSRSAKSTSRYIEAAVAGGILGFLQGILFAVIITRMTPINDNELTNTIAIIIGMIVAGMIVSAVLAFVSAYLREQRKG